MIRPAVAEFLQELRRLAPDASISIDAPADLSRGAWTLDVTSTKNVIVVQYRPTHGFGVSTTDDVGYGEGPDEVYGEAEAAARRSADLLRTGAKTESRKR